MEAWTSDLHEESQKRRGKKHMFVENSESRRGSSTGNLRRSARLSKKRAVQETSATSAASGRKRRLSGIEEGDEESEQPGRKKRRSVSPSQSSERLLSWYNPGILRPEHRDTEGYSASDQADAGDYSDVAEPSPQLTSDTRKGEVYRESSGSPVPNRWSPVYRPISPDLDDFDPSTYGQWVQETKAEPSAASEKPNRRGTKVSRRARSCEPYDLERHNEWDRRASWGMNDLEGRNIERKKREIAITEAHISKSMRDLHKGKKRDREFFSHNAGDRFAEALDEYLTDAQKEVLQNRRFDSEPPVRYPNVIHDWTFIGDKYLKDQEEERKARWEAEIREKEKGKFASECLGDPDIDPTRLLASIEDIDTVYDRITATLESLKKEREFIQEMRKFAEQENRRAEEFRILYKLELARVTRVASVIEHWDELNEKVNSDDEIFFGSNGLPNGVIPGTEYIYTIPHKSPDFPFSP